MLTALRHLGAQLSADGDQLRCHAPPGALTADLQMELARYRAEILIYLQQLQGATRTPLPPLRPVPRHGALPLSFAQQRLWFLEQLQPASAAYNVSVACRLTGTLNVAALSQSLNALVQRHEVLRSTFPTVAGQPRQAIAPSLALPLPVVDLRGLPAGAQQAEIQRCATAEAQRPFALACGPLLRTTLLWLDAERHVLLLGVHQIIWDGWSSRLFFRELAALYAAGTARTSPLLPELPVQYADFAHWQREALQGEVLDTLLAYWQRQLDGAPTVLELRSDCPRSAVQTFRGAQCSLALPQALAESLRSLSHAQGVTLFMTLLAAFNVLLHRYTGQDDMLVGSAIAGRSRPETEGLIGFFVNTLVLRTDLSGNPTFQRLLQRVRDVALGAYAHQDLPFELLVEALRPQRDLSRTPLFQVFVNMHNFTASHIELPGLTLDIAPPHEPAAKFDVSLHVREQQTGILLLLVYNADLFEDATMTRLLEHFQTLLAGIVDHPAQPLSHLPFLTASQRQQGAAYRPCLRPARSGSADTVDQADIEQSIPARFAQQVQTYPHKVAVKTQQYAWTYSTLNAMANRVARALLSRQGGGAERVALLFDHDAPMIASILGVLQAGKTYVPLDPLAPQERLRYCLQDLQTHVILTHSAHAALAQALTTGTLQSINVDTLDAAAPGQEINLPIAPDAGAYILYTSGSTGEPKGVLQNHRNVLFFIGMYTQSLQISPADRLTLLAHYGCDAAVMDIFAALLNGATLYPYDLRTQELTHLAAWLQDESITIYHSTPTVYRHFVRTLPATARFPALRRLVMGGEPLYRDDVERYQQLFSQDCALVNGYGPTESTLALQYHMSQQTEVRRHSVPLGYAVQGIETLVLNDAGAPMQGYGIGEIAIRSQHLALGYWRQPALTAAAFRPDPVDASKRIYYTGDVGRWLPDGSLEFVGRKDWQVKVRGYRVELGEIETALCQHPAMQEAVVVARQEQLGDTQLIAYVVPARAPAPPGSALRQWLQAKLPAYMLPAAFVTLAALPLTPNGKIDRLALPVPHQTRTEPDAEGSAPSTPIEEMLAGIWATVLGVEQVSRDENFFDLGGHSLMATQVISRLREALRVEVPLRLLFEAPTVASMALLIEAMQQTTQEVPAPPMVPMPREASAPLSVAQEQVWLLDQVLPGTGLFNISWAARLLGSLNRAALEQSCNAMLQRHAALRTTFAIVDGQPVQIIAPALDATLPVHDLQALPEPERQGAARRLAQEETSRPFNLAEGPLLRVCLLRLHEHEHVLLMTMHHIISDGWSLGVLQHELAVLYNAFAAGQQAPLPEPSIQYADVVHWQRMWRGSEAMAAQLAYWTQQLHDPLPVLTLPADRPRGRAVSLRTARQSFVIPPGLAQALSHLSRREASTLFMTLLAAFKVLLCSYTGQTDLCVSTLVANRNRHEVEGLVGLFLNTLLLRTDLSGNPTFREILQRVRATTLAAYAHQDLPFADLAQALEHERHLQRRSLCQVMFILQNARRPPPALSGLTLHLLETDAAGSQPGLTITTCDIIVMVSESSSGLAGSCIYKTALFDATTINQMLDAFQRLLAQIIAQPEQPLALYGVTGSPRH